MNASGNLLRRARVVVGAVVLVCALWGGLGHGAFAADPLTLRSSVDVVGRDVRLSDLFMGIAAESDRVIAQAPPPGKNVTYDARVLTHVAEQHKLKWSPESAYDRIVITRSAKFLTVEMVREAVLEKVRAAMDAARPQDKVAVQLDGRLPMIALPADREVQFTLPNFSYDAAQKRFRSDVRAETGAAPYMISVSGRVVISREVPVLVRRVDAGEMIAASDLDWVLLPEDRAQADMVIDSQQLVGRALRRVGGIGQPVMMRDIIPPRLVTRGSLVVLKVETPYMLVTTQGRAMADGGAGDVIRVTNTQSNRVVEGVVEASGVVRVQTASQQVFEEKGKAAPQTIRTRQ